MNDSNIHDRPMTGKREYIALNMKLLLIFTALLAFYPTAWVGFLISVIYFTLLKKIWFIPLLSAAASFLLVKCNSRKALGASLMLGFAGGFAGTFLFDCDEILKTQLRYIFFIMLWVTVIAPAVDFALFHFEIHQMLM